MSPSSVCPQFLIRLPALPLRVYPCLNKLSLYFLNLSASSWHQPTEAMFSVITEKPSGPQSGPHRHQHCLQPITTNNKGVDRRHQPGPLKPTMRDPLREQREIKAASSDQKEPRFPNATLANEQPTLPFIPNFDRRPYLLIMIKRTTNRTQAKAASPTAMDTCQEPNRDRQAPSLKTRGVCQQHAGSEENSPIIVATGALPEPQKTPELLRLRKVLRRHNL